MACSACLHNFVYLFCCRFKLLVIDHDDQSSLRQAVLSYIKNTTPEVVALRTETMGNPPPTNKSHKGLLLTTLTEIVSERISSTDVTVQQQLGTFTPEQQLVAYLSEPVIPVRSSDSRVNSQNVLAYWYHHIIEWPALTCLALSYLSCLPSSVTSDCFQATSVAQHL